MAPSLHFAHGGALEFAVGFAAFEFFAFVELGFAFADGEGDFDFAVFPVEGEGKEGVAFDGGQGEEFADFGFVEEEFAGGFGLVVLEVAVGVFVDVGVVEEDFVVIDASKGVGDLAFAGAKCFDFGAVEDDASLEGVEDVEVAAGLGVGEDVGHGGGSVGRPRPTERERGTGPARAA